MKKSIERADKGIINDEFAPKKKSFQLIRLLKYFRPYLGLLILTIIMAGIINISVLVRPYILKHVIDDYLTPGIYDLERIRLLGIIYFLAITGTAVFIYLQTNILAYIGQKIMYDIRNQIFGHIQNMSMKFFDKNSSGRILTRVTNDVEALNEVFSGVLINAFRDVIMILGIIAAMFALSTKLALISISTVPLIFIITVVYRIAARKNFVKLKGLVSKINGFLAENISGMKLVQIFHREKEKYDQFIKIEKDYLKCSLREVLLKSLGKPIIDIIYTIAISLLVWFFWRETRVLGSIIEIGVLIAFISYLKQFFQPISELADQYTSIQSAIISSQRIFEILDTFDVQEDMESGIPIDRIKGEIEFRNVWFAYNDNDWVLRGISFRINPGEAAAFVGATGSGKSTIINLMARFYDINKGEILIDGIDIKRYRLKDLRKNIAVVLQDVFLFSGDIKTNIRLNNTDISDEVIVSAAKDMNADTFIESLPEKYDEEVMEKGSTFSAGQRQLISFARAVAFNPSILVLDEATSNIDTETEAKLQEALLRICEKRTAIIIAHRLSTIQSADKIIVIKKGRICEMGNHEELIILGGIYSDLYYAQFQETT